MGVDLITKNGFTGYDREAYLMFDMASTGITTATSATLRLYCNLDNGGNSELYKISDDTWTETGITWANKPTSSSLISSQAGNVGYMEWNVTSYINEELAGNDKASFRVLATNDAYIYFNSKEASSNKPELVVIGIGENPMGVIDDIITDTNINIYPNPVTNSGLRLEMKNIELKQVKAIQIFDIYGRLIIEKHQFLESEISFPMKSTGSYIVKIYTNNGTIIKKVIVY